MKGDKRPINVENNKKKKRGTNASSLFPSPPPLPWESGTRRWRSSSNASNHPITCLSTIPISPNNQHQHHRILRLFGFDWLCGMPVLVRFWFSINCVDWVGSLRDRFGGGRGTLLQQWYYEEPNPGFVIIVDRPLQHATWGRSLNFSSRYLPSFFFLKNKNKNKNDTLECLE